MQCFVSLFAIQGAFYPKVRLFSRQGETRWLSRVSLRLLLLLTVALAMHGAVRAVTAAGASSLLFLPDEVDRDSNDYGKKNGRDDDRRQVCGNPVQHGNHSFRRVSVLRDQCLSLSLVASL